MRLDHLVINTRFEMEAAVSQFEALGFTLTPRGVHTLGSINHLMMFPDHYLELIGLPTGTDKLRADVLESPGGIDGLVMQTDAPEAAAAALEAQGLAVTAPQYFSRPVEIDGVAGDARFCTVRMKPGQFQAGRVYYCDHLTPERVWHAPWLHHANGALGIASLTVVGHDTAALREQYAMLDVCSPRQGDNRGVAAADDANPGTPAVAFALAFETPDSFAARFGALSRYAPVLAATPGDVRDAPDDAAAPRAGYFGAITVRVADLGDVATRATHGRLPVTIEGDADVPRVIVALPAYSTLLEFIL